MLIDFGGIWMDYLFHKLVNCLNALKEKIKYIPEMHVLYWKQNIMLNKRSKFNSMWYIYMCVCVFLKDNLGKRSDCLWSTLSVPHWEKVKNFILCQFCTHSFCKPFQKRLGSYYFITTIKCTARILEWKSCCYRSCNRRSRNLSVGLKNCNKGNLLYWENTF